MKWIYVMMIALMFTACQDDNCGQDIFTDGEQKEEQERVPVQLGISLGNYSTYSTVEEEIKTSAEIGDMKSADFYIFRQNGTFLESHMDVSLNYSNTSGNSYFYETNVFELPKGNYYIYVIIQRPDRDLPSRNFITEPTESTTMLEFERQEVVFGTLPKEQTGVNWMSSYLQSMATPVRELKTITGTGNPEVIRLKVGHFFSKVKVNDWEPKATGGLKGKFTQLNTTTSRISFNISCRPRKMHLIGQWEGDYMMDMSQVISPHYQSYDTTLHFRSPLYEYPSNGTQTWYTIENTNQKPNIENTSFFVLGFIYTPDKDEIHSLNNLVSGEALIDNTFYLAEFANGSKLIYAKPPTVGTIVSDRGAILRVKTYKKGICYYRVPLEDNKKNTNALRYSVIRNHYYVLTVNSISGLGNDCNDDWDTWEPPWEEDIDIDAILEVVDWVPYDIPVELEGK